MFSCVSATAEKTDPNENSLPIGLAHFRVAQAIYAVLVELDADPDALMVEAGLDPRFFECRGKLVPYSSLGRLIAVAVARTHCPHLGLLIGQRTTMASLGLLGLLLRNSDTVGDALRALEAYLGMLNRGAVVGLGIDGEMAVLSYCPYEPGAEGAVHHSDRALATATNILRALCGSGWAPLEVLLPRTAPSSTLPYTQFFRAPVRFDQETAALAFPAQLLDHHIPEADPVIRRRVMDRIRRLEGTQPSTLTDGLRQHLRAEVIRKRCDATKTARHLSLTRRTLSRRLRAEGTSFRQLANEAQYRVAKRLLADTRMNLTEISIVLDFSEPAGFTHAFRRWSGMTPSAWRRENQPETKRNRQYEDPRLCGKGVKYGSRFTPVPVLS
jgi:AraC-like DNA-binding protein